MFRLLKKVARYVDNPFKHPDKAFALHGTDLYAFGFATPLGFLFVWRGIEKTTRTKKMLELSIDFEEGIKILMSVCTDFLVTHQL